MSDQKYCVYCMGEMPVDGHICPYCGGDADIYVAKMYHLRPFTILNGKYLIGKVLGEGGFSITYIARDLNLDMQVAVKEYYPYGYVNRNHFYSDRITVSGAITGAEFEAGKEKLMKEARTLARFSDLKGIVGVRDFFAYHNTAYIVMDYLEGVTLKEYLRKNGLMTLEQIVGLLMPIMEDLVRVHETGLIHRDISPDNIMILKDGSARLLDFGAARLADSRDARSLSIVLKPGYTPEEQYRTKGEQGPWTDVYALSAVIYRTIMGTAPCEALQRMVDDRLNPPSKLGVELPAGKERALMKGLAVKKEDRYQNIIELKNGLAEGEGADPAREKRRAGRDTARASRSHNKRWLLAAVLVILIVLAGGLWFLEQGNAPAPDALKRMSGFLWSVRSMVDICK